MKKSTLLTGILLLLTACTPALAPAAPTASPRPSTAAPTEPAPTITPTSEPSATPEPSATSTPNPVDIIRQRIKMYNNPELDALIDQYQSGSFHTVEDTEMTGNITSNLYHQEYDFSPTDFLAITDVDYESASKATREATTGCGYSFRTIQDGGYYILFTLDNEVRLTFSYSGHWTGLAHHKDMSLKLASPNGSAQMLVAVTGKHITFAINGKTMLNQDSDLLWGEGNFGYSLFSGINKDYGTRCTFKNTMILVNKYQ